MAIGHGDSTRRTGPAAGAASLYFPLGLTAHGWGTAGRSCSDSPITHSTSLPKALQMQHLHSVTRGWTHTPHRAAVPWLYEEWTSLQWQKTPPWSSDKAAPVQPCPEAQRWCVPGVTKLPIWTKHTHAPIHKVCDTAFQVLSLLQISLKELQICKLSYAKKPPPKHQTCFRWKQTFSEEIKQQ